MEEPKTSSESPSEIKSKNKLPPVRTLIEESWHLLTAKALKLLILVGLVFAVLFALVIVLMILGLVFAGGLGLGSFSDPAAFSSLLSQPSVIGGFGILLGFFVVSIIALTIAVQAANILILGDESEIADEVSVISYIKQGFSHVWKLFLLGIMMIISIYGGFFLFIIPGIIVSIFLMFSLFILVIEKTSVIESMRLSVARVSQFFGAIIGRVLLLWVIMIAAQMIIGSFGSNDSMAGIVALLSMILSIGGSWFAMAYTYKIYVHTREAYDPEKKSSMTWIWVVTVLGWVIGGLIIFGIMSAAKNTNVQDLIQEITNEATAPGEAKDINSESMMGDMMEADGSMTDQVLTYMNVVRASSGLEPLTESQQLCAYSARRLKQMKDFEGFDDYAGFYEDMGNQAAGSTFFRGYSNIVNIVRDRQVGETEAVMVGASIVKEQEDNAVFKSSFSDACVRADDDFVSIVIGEKSI